MPCRIPVLQIRKAYFSWAEAGSPAGREIPELRRPSHDLDRWRRERLAEKMLAFLRSPGYEICFPDSACPQCGLGWKWQQLHPRWNVTLHSACRCLPRLPREERALLAQAIARPSILHFAAGPKPWEKGCLPTGSSSTTSTSTARAGAAGAPDRRAPPHPRRRLDEALRSNSSSAPSRRSLIVHDPTAVDYPDCLRARNLRKSSE